jgi:hypothetical protein
MLKKFVYKRLQGHELSGSQYAKPNEYKIMFNKKFIDVITLKSRIFYQFYLQKQNTKPNMRSVWRNEFGLNTLYWSKTIQQKLYDFEYLKLKEFN